MNDYWKNLRWVNRIGLMMIVVPVVAAVLGLDYTPIILVAVIVPVYTVVAIHLLTHRKSGR